MNLDYDTLDQLRRNHPAWRLLRSDHAALAASFLNRVFITPNERVLAQSDLAEALEDELYALREHSEAGAFPRDALAYLNDWASPEKGWLRKFYRQDSDEPQFDLTPATEKAIAWLSSLTERSFVGTESRLLTLFELLRQMSEGTTMSVVMMKNVPQSPSSQSTSSPEEAANRVRPAVPMEASSAYWVAV